MRKQYDVNFKVNIVRTANFLKNNGKHGQIKDLLRVNGVTGSMLHYWRKQFNQGHFNGERAVAFSRKDTMVHG
jgi:transposase-like protein